MNKLGTYLFQELRTSYPTIDWSLGSVARELWLEPLAAMAQKIDCYIEAAKRDLNIDALITTPEENKERIEELAASYGINTTLNIKGTGTIALSLNSDSDIAISKGTTFTWLDQAVIVPYNIYGTANEATDTNSAVRVLFKQIAPGCFELDIPVETFEDHGVTLECGATLNWSNAPDSVYDIRVKSPVTGGRKTDSLIETAQKIKARMFPASYTGEALLNTALLGMFPLDYNSCVLGEPVGDNACVYIKPKRLPEIITINCLVRNTAQGLQCVISNTPGCIAVKKVYTETGNIIPFEVSVDDRAACNVYTITLEPTTETADELTDTICCVDILKYTQYEKFFDALNQGMSGLPYGYKLKTPINKYVTLTAYCKGNPLNNSSLISALQKKINDLPITTASLTDSMFTSVFKAFSVILTGPIQYTVDSGFQRLETTVNGFTSKYQNSDPIAYWSSMERIHLNYV